MTKTMDKDLEKIVDRLIEIDKEWDAIKLDPDRHKDNPWETDEEFELRMLTEEIERLRDEAWDKFNLDHIQLDKLKSWREV